MIYNNLIGNIFTKYVIIKSLSLEYLSDVKAGKKHNSTKVVRADVSLNMNGKKVGRIPALCSISAVELEQAHRNRGGHGHP